jgi:phosphatidylglycerol:prolipoprotein diacylglycerol transferase
VPVCLFLGRCANFLNGELWGRPTDVGWGVIFPDAPRIDGVNVPRYPSQLIEALLEGVLLQLILIAVRFSAKREGAVALTFMAGYALLRIAGEQFRQPDQDIGFWFGSITQGQLLSGIMLVVTAFLAWLQFFARPAPGSPIKSTATPSSPQP